MRDNVIVSIPLVDTGLEYLHSLARNLRATQPADKFFTFSAEHRTANHLDPSEPALGKVHLFLYVPDKFLSLAAVAEANGEYRAIKNDCNCSKPGKISVLQPRIHPL